MDYTMGLFHGLYNGCFIDYTMDPAVFKEYYPDDYPNKDKWLIYGERTINY
jgi:hypothetical protein